MTARPRRARSPGRQCATSSRAWVSTFTAPTPSDRDAAAARDWLARLAARPRPAGSAAEATARDACRAHLGTLGFAVRDVPFTYATWPGRWATPAAGGLWILTALTAGHLAAHGQAGAAAAVLVASAAAMATAGRWVARHGVLASGRTVGVNLEATRGIPAVWLVAHLDSKSQPVPILLRAAGIVASALCWTLMVVLALGHATGMVWHVVTMASVLAGLPVVLSAVGAHSPGAVDNASGVATVLLAAAGVDRSVPLGVLLTSAEELGLAGARAWVRETSKSTVINCDSIDDRGYLTIMYSHGRPERLIRAFDGQAARVRRVIPGVLVDGVAFADAGWDAVTVSRGTAQTLARIHRRADTAALLTGVGVSVASHAVAEAIRKLTACSTKPHAQS